MNDELQAAIDKWLQLDESEHYRVLKFLKQLYQDENSYSFTTVDIGSLKYMMGAGVIAYSWRVFVLFDAISASHAIDAFNPKKEDADSSVRCLGRNFAEVSTFNSDAIYLRAPDSKN